MIFDSRRTDRSRMRRRCQLAMAAVFGCLTLASTSAYADDQEDTEEGPPPQVELEQPEKTIPSSKRNIVPVQPESSEQRVESIVPTAATTPPPTITFAADPVADGGIILGAGVFAGILDLINSTGEIRPQQISPTFQRSHLLGIDRDAIDQKADSESRLRSNIGLFAALGFAAVDPVLTGFREKNVQAGIVDGLIYGETMALTWGVTNLAKMAVRRPRPQAYIDAEAHRDDPTYSNSNTDSALSFFSGHASMTAAVSATATYLAFARSPRGTRGWITLGVGAALTTVVSVERVRAAAHFPTDVIAGVVAGAGIGVIVPHLHRNEDPRQRRVWIGMAPESGSGGSIQVGGVF